MDWLVDLLSPQEGKPDRRIAVGVGLLAVAAVVVALVPKQKKPMGEAEARAAFMKSLGGPPEEREAAKARWDEAKLLGEP